MNETIKQQIIKEINKKEAVRKEKKGAEKLKNFSWPSFFAGEEYNQELDQNSEIKDRINLIDCEKISNENKEFLEKKIKEIYDSSQNKQLIQEENFPIIWFKNIDQIKKDSALEKALLPVFDPAQNSSLSKGVNLTQFLLIATSKGKEVGKIPNPLMSRLDCINVDTAQPKQFF
ncbi:6950_t:CDS:1 [Ambispora leptoticha]|uniref:6950_t:CDS:1 n=1 Tax=Ambispora leptoticha TaxID=144679 RepID=A0A9N8V4A4_9GLOM|nr:6950_t:CDS:1 [Ambispora leptoticha]